MKVQIRVLSGARKGQVFVFSEGEITVGRAPASSLQFDPNRDLDVSTRHAVISLAGGRWHLRDLGSKNGTLINGHLVSEDTQISDTDQVQFGASGPKVEFRLVPETVPDACPPLPTPPPAAAAPETAGKDRVPQPATSSPQPRRTAQSPTQRIRVEVARQTKGLRRITIALGAIIAVVVVTAFWQTRSQRLEREREAAAFQATLDSILASSDAAIQELQGEMQGLASALESRQSEIRALRNRLETAREAGNDQQVEALRQELEVATSALRNQQVAAQVNYNTIFENNQRAVAILWVEYTTGEVVTGTAFSVDSQGILLTNKHVVRGENGRKTPRRLAVKFADSDQVFRAELLAVSPAVDLAAVRVSVAGAIPTVQGLASSTSARPGDPVAIIGFPLGEDLPMTSRGDRTVARTSFNAGIVSKVLDDLVQVDGYGTHGSSGSPILDSRGMVVGILYGGEPGSAGRIIYAVPARYARELLSRLRRNPP